MYKEKIPLIQKFSCSKYKIFETMKSFVEKLYDDDYTATVVYDESDEEVDILQEGSYEYTGDSDGGNWQFVCLVTNFSPE